MGGNNALIIDEIVDVDAVVNLAIQSAFVSAGQRCTCARRILVKMVLKVMHLFNVLLKLLKLKVGRWNDEQQPFMGGVISSVAATNMMHAQQKLLELGAKSLLAMTRPQENSSLLTPGIVDVTGVADIPDEEYFGRLPPFNVMTTLMKH